jgi:hypothetical protein
MVVAGLVLAAAPAAAEAVYTRGAVQVVGQAQLQGNEKRGLSMFRQRARDFNGAFYISQNADHAEWWVDEHRLEDAKTIAKANCEANDGVSGPCVLHAVVVPAGNPVGSGKVVKNINGSLSREMARSSKKGGAGTFGAAAANRVGKYGMSWGHPTREAARKDALLTCQRSIEQGGGADVYSDYMSVETFQRLLASGRFDCKIVAEFRN